MSIFAGYEPRALPRVAGSIACGAFALTALSIAQPAHAADLEYGYGAPRVYHAPAYPPPRHGEYYAPPPLYREAPVEYRVVVYPPQPRYVEVDPQPAPAWPPVRYGTVHEDPYGYRVAEAPPRYAPRRVDREADVDRRYRDLPYEPYGRALDPDVPVPPGLVGPPRW
jgi:hypothetical protein